MPEITLGASNYLQLIQKGVPEIALKSIICLDADQAFQTTGKGFGTVVLLPGDLPPDQLIFEHLYNLPAQDEFWKNSLLFTRDVFTNLAREVISEFAINQNTVSVKAQLDAYQGDKKPREVFKRFYKDTTFQMCVSSGMKVYNPWKHWVDSNPAASNRFLRDFEATVHKVMKNGYFVDVAKLATLKVKLKKI